MPDPIQSWLMMQWQNDFLPQQTINPPMTSGASLGYPAFNLPSFSGSNAGAGVSSGGLNAGTATGTAADITKTISDTIASLGDQTKSQSGIGTVPTKIYPHGSKEYWENYDTRKGSINDTMTWLSGKWRETAQTPTTPTTPTTTPAQTPIPPTTKELYYNPKDLESLGPDWKYVVDYRDLFQGVHAQDFNPLRDQRFYNPITGELRSTMGGPVSEKDRLLAEELRSLKR